MRLSTSVVCTALLLSGCGSELDPSPSWEVAHQENGGALLSVWGTGPSDVWAVGGQAGQGLILHSDGVDWRSIDIDADQLLSWTYGFRSDDVYAVGERGLILHYDGSSWRRVESGTDKNLYGLWGASGDDVWIVGGDPKGPAGSAVVLRGSRGSFQRVEGIPAELLPSALYKAYGSPNGLVAVGAAGTVLRFEADVWRRESAPTSEPIFSLWGRADDDVYAVGGDGRGELLHYDGSMWSEVFGGLEHGLSGVFTAPDQPMIAVGDAGYVVEVDVDGQAATPELPYLEPTPWLHSVWGDREGTTYAVGGDLYAYPAAMTGVILRRQ